MIEERKLINAIANQVGLIVERIESEENKSILEEQIRHADRLATIGQLAAGVAHELNEPLGNILGLKSWNCPIFLIPQTMTSCSACGRDSGMISPVSLNRII